MVRMTTHRTPGHGVTAAPRLCAMSDTLKIVTDSAEAEFAVTEGTMIVGDYVRFAGLHMRQGVEVQVGYVNDDFTDGRVTIRAGARAALVHYRPAAFTAVTGV